MGVSKRALNEGRKRGSQKFCGLQVGKCIAEECCCVD